ncbi:MAG TPA: DMT family transporter [Acidimicrobiia bacterium]|nr:DMT family transporter [Acidimicrobiia bacterium]
MRPIYWFALVVASIGWAFGGIMTSAAFDEGVGAWTMVAIRVLIAAVLVGMLLLVRRPVLPSATVVRYGLIQAVTNLTIPYILFTFAYDEASVGFVGLLAALIPLSTAVFANYMLQDEPLTVAKTVGLLVAFSGVAFLLLSGDSGLPEGGRPVVAVGLALTAVASIGFAASFAKRHAGTYDATTMTGLQFGFSAVGLVIAMLLIEGAPTNVSVTGWWLMVGMAIASTFMPFLIYFWILQHVSATNVSLTGYLVPFIALVGGLLLLDEELQPGIAVGFVLVFTGLVLADRASRRVPHEVAPEIAETWPAG